ncbi:SDR family NAD(P)-dependent oxidoreductase [Streptomyces johnsoniae]|uniref:SDR family NAD(P)-dependent oxidoreductase n=1 Tax=Streptomyces johnsoniae TaxID=3075532 RepID=A0ABU2SAJ4_9ACTN|nr:SDR family NAD(P)-dependent oxidoreductase [Streptomyces sp. DSM 41886]MDT0445130.1 SDR family NAD(P)-dependent oxidoreductase [Streptomyces sp. DSM 41886]
MSSADDATERPTTTALITGAGRGIGAEVARQLGRLGTRVVLTARDPADAAAAAGPIDGAEAMPVGVDIADQASVETAAQLFAARWGHLDILINNAAAPPDRDETPSQANLAAASDALRVTLFGTWRMTQAFLPLLRRSSHPRIVNVSSGAGSHTDGQYGFPAFGGAAASHAISKAALNAFTAVLAAELSDTPVIVNAVCPGVTATVPGAEAFGARPVEESAPGIIWAATLPDHGPRGGFFRDTRPLGW